MPVRWPEEPLEFLGCRIGRNYRPGGRGAYIGTRPGKESIQGICSATESLESGIESLESNSHTERTRSVLDSIKASH